MRRMRVDLEIRSSLFYPLSPKELDHPVKMAVEDSRRRISLLDEMKTDSQSWLAIRKVTRWGRTFPPSR